MLIRARLLVADTYRTCGRAHRSFETPPIAAAAVWHIRAGQSTELDVPRYLYASGRCAVAHAYADPLVDPDDISDLHRLSQDLYVIKAVAEHLIEVELG